MLLYDGILGALRKELSSFDLGTGWGITMRRAWLFKLGLGRHGGSDLRINDFKIANIPYNAGGARGAGMLDALPTTEPDLVR
jgi:hypothetical protein